MEIIVISQIKIPSFLTFTFIFQSNDRCISSVCWTTKALYFCISGREQAPNWHFSLNFETIKMAD